jgi:hypothetical protein
MIDMVSLFFEVVTLSLQLAILLMFYAQFHNQPIDKSIPLCFLVGTVFFNVIFHFPATHYGLDGQTSLRMVFKSLVSLASESAKLRLYASSHALRSGAIAASGRVFRSHGSERHPKADSETEDSTSESESRVESTEPVRKHSIVRHLGVAGVVGEDFAVASASSRGEQQCSGDDLVESDTSLPKFIVDNLAGMVGAGSAPGYTADSDADPLLNSLHGFNSRPRASMTEAEYATLTEQSESESEADATEALGTPVRGIRRHEPVSDEPQPLHESGPARECVRPMRLSTMTSCREGTALPVGEPTEADSEADSNSPHPFSVPIVPLAIVQDQFIDLRPPSRPSSQPRASTPVRSSRARPPSADDLACSTVAGQSSLE